MFREVRRKDREISKDEAIKILGRCKYGVLSTVGEDGYPYGVPLNYVCIDNCIYFHSAAEGHKLDNLKHNEKVSFCVVGSAQIIPESFSTRYESVIAFGNTNEVSGDEKESILQAIIEKYAEEFMDKGRELIGNAGKSTKVIKLCIQHISGKARR